MGESPDGERWGILGGSFDPPHLGHLIVAAVAMARGRLDRLVVVPCFDHPFGKHPAPFADRMEMARRAFRVLTGTRVSDIESRLPRPSLTLRTVEALREAHPEVSVWRLVVGGDTVAERSSWHRFDEVAAKAEPLIVGRSGYPAAGIAFEVPDVNSTRIRAGLAAGEDVSAWLDPDVETYLRSRGLYEGSDTII
jgi:nicotinate-nucleotide adenylyltransferase